MEIDEELERLESAYGQDIEIIKNHLKGEAIIVITLHISKYKPPINKKENATTENATTTSTTTSADRADDEGKSESNNSSSKEKKNNKSKNKNQDQTVVFHVDFRINMKRFPLEVPKVSIRQAVKYTHDITVELQRAADSLVGELKMISILVEQARVLCKTLVEKKVTILPPVIEQPQLPFDMDWEFEVPVEVMLKVFSFLDGVTICTAVKPVCKSWYEAASYKKLWAYVYFKQFGAPSYNHQRKHKNNYFEMYKAKIKNSYYFHGFVNYREKRAQQEEKETMLAMQISLAHEEERQRQLQLEYIRQLEQQEKKMAMNNVFRDLNDDKKFIIDLIEVEEDDEEDEEVEVEEEEVEYEELEEEEVEEEEEEEADE